MSLETIREAQRNFNRKYGVKFDIDEFDGSANGLSDLDSSNVSGEVVDDLYRATFTELYKKAYESFVDRKSVDTMDFVGMLDEFDRTIMAPYRATLGSGTKARAYGGWTVSRYLNGVKTHLGSVADNKIQYAVDRYSQRKLPIRSMRAFARQLKNKPDAPSTKELSTLYCYAESLLQANKARKGIWKLLNLSRHLAEQREAKEFKKYISEVIGEPLVQSADNTKFSEILAHLNDDLITSSKSSVGDAIATAEANEKNQTELKNSKQHVNIDETSLNGQNVAVSAKVVETKQLSINEQERT